MSTELGQAETAGRRRAWIAIAALAAAGALAVLCRALLSICPPFVRQAVTHRWFVIPALIALVCLVLIAGLCAMLWRAGRTRRAAGARAQEGQAVLEFALVMPILLMLSLVMVQSSLLVAGNVNLHYSAYCAARAAIVAIPLHTDEEKPSHLAAYDSGPGRNDSWKMQRVYAAAVWALIPYSCGSNDVPPAPDAADLEGDLARLFGQYQRKEPKWAHDYLGRKLQYAREHTQVYVDPPRPEETEMYAANADIHVTVEHDLYLAVPYANRVFAAVGGGRKLEFASGEYALEMRVESHLTSEGVQDFIDIEEFPRPN